jgi:hypothetical protein
MFIKYNYLLAQHDTGAYIPFFIGMRMRHIDNFEGKINVFREN